MRMSNLPQNISEETVLRMRAKMEDLTYQRFEEQGSPHLAFRMPGEKIDILQSLEYLSEFLNEELIRGVDRIIIISDRDLEVVNGSMMEKKIEQKSSDDDDLYMELKYKLQLSTPPLVFTMENDILDLFRVALRSRGSLKDEGYITEDVLKAEIPKEGAVVYIVFDDGYRKVSRISFDKEVEEVRSRRQFQPQVAKDRSPNGTLPPSARTGSPSPPKSQPPYSVVRTDHIRKLGDKNVLKEASKNLEKLGYREDARFSRPDVNQIFLLGMKGPSLLLKVAMGSEDIDPFLRVLEHRRDVLGLLLSDEWTAELEVRSRAMGFVLLTGDRIKHVNEVVAALVKGGGN
jgi:hypothetical protein